MEKNEFLSKANEIHNKMYEYPSLNENVEGNIMIRCHRHGNFYTSVYHHLQGEGCFECYKENNWK